MKLNIYGKRKPVQEARHIQGSLSALLALEKTDLTVQKIREIANDIYNKTDNFLNLLDEMEAEHEDRQDKGIHFEVKEKTAK